ncbi:MAG TPA: lycopene cyclase domain-containing protein [Chloroflexota bacterium]|nr:lycopene cyclase domain-containing protein [Chloroflexota bacterium]
MTYLEFLALFLGCPLLVLALALHDRLRRADLLILALLAILALAYTAPWDNLLVAQGVWTYQKSGILAVIGRVPLEEYVFYLSQVGVSGLWTFSLLTRSRRQ